VSDLGGFGDIGDSSMEKCVKRLTGKAHERAIVREEGANCLKNKNLEHKHKDGNSGVRDRSLRHTTFFGYYRKNSIIEG